jgi:hypothetical protein
MRHDAILRKALSGAVRALERIIAGGEAATAAETALEAAKTALERTVEPEHVTIRLRVLRVPTWTVRYSQTKGHEGNIVQTVYSASGKPVCRVIPGKTETDTENRVQMLAAAPEMLSALVDACGQMRASGLCYFPTCESCRIGAVLSRFKFQKIGFKN